MTHAWVVWDGISGMFPVTRAANEGLATCRVQALQVGMDEAQGILA
jgi:hypothetical protein